MSAPFLLGLRILLTLALYAFLGWAFLSIWQDVHRQGMLLATKKVPGITISLSLADGTPFVRNFSQPEISLGRDPTCDIHLPDETVSARHARLIHHHGQWWIEDLGSTNGTRLNNDRLSTPAVVTSGDQIECGRASLTIGLRANEQEIPTQKLERARDTDD